MNYKDEVRQINSELLCFLRHPTVVQISIMTKRHSQPTKVPVCVKISPFTSFWTFPRGLASCSHKTESVWVGWAVPHSVLPLTILRTVIFQTSSTTHSVKRKDATLSIPRGWMIWSMKGNLKCRNFQQSKWKIFSFLYGLLILISALLFSLPCLHRCPRVSTVP